MRAASIALIVAASLLTSVAPAGAGGAPGDPEVVTGQGTAVFDAYYHGLHCEGRAFDIQMVIADGTALVTLQALTPDVTPCNTVAQYYSVNPSVVYGDWEQGWSGEAVGVGVIWPIWDVTITPTAHPDVWHLWSYYVDENGRDYLFEGDFTIEMRI